MANELPIPPELQHLIEKREREDRRHDERRNQVDEETLQPKSSGEIGSVDDSADAVAENQAGTGERRFVEDRRQESRRDADT